MKKEKPFILRFLLIIGGSLAVGLGILGIFVPILPTTPFLLLAGLLYAKSSTRLHYWLLHNRVFGRYLKNYLTGKGISLPLKIFTISLLWITIGFTAFLVVQALWLRLLLFGIALAVTIHLMVVKTYRNPK